MTVYSLPATLPESIATVSGTHSSIRIVSAKVAQWLEHPPPYHVCHIFTPQYLHICKEQICAYPCFRPVPPNSEQRQFIEKFCTCCCSFFGRAECKKSSHVHVLCQVIVQFRIKNSLLNINIIDTFLQGQPRRKVKYSEILASKCLKFEYTQQTE